MMQMVSIASTKSIRNLHLEAGKSGLSCLLNPLEAALRRSQYAVLKGAKVAYPIYYYASIYIYTNRLPCRMRIFVSLY